VWVDAEEQVDLARVRMWYPHASGVGRQMGVAGWVVSLWSGLVWSAPQA